MINRKIRIKKLKPNNIIISYYLSLIIFCSLIYFIIPGNCQEDHYINYKSDFFQIRLEDETFYGGVEHYLNLRINLLENNNIKNISMKLEIIDKATQEISYSVENEYFYNIYERAIYENNSKLGIIPLFIEPNISQGQIVTLAEFNNRSLVGTHVEESGYLIISNKRIPYHWVLVEEANYTAYYYSDFENILIYWEIGNSYDITLDNLFGFKKFYGHIKYEKSSYDIKWSTYSPIESYLPLILIGSLFCIGFISIFLLIRRSLKLKDKEEKAYRNRKLRK